MAECKRYDPRNPQGLTVEYQCASHNERVKHCDIGLQEAIEAAVDKVLCSVIDYLKQRALELLSSIGLTYPQSSATLLLAFPRYPSSSL